MNRLKKSAVWLAVLAVCVMAGAPVFAKDLRQVSVSRPLAVNGTQIEPGDYKISWESQGTEAQVTFLSGKKVVATAPAKVVDGSQKFSSSLVYFDVDAAGTAKLTKIRFGGTSQSLVFTQ